MTAIGRPGQTPLRLSRRARQRAKDSAPPAPLAQWADVSAYVLLGEPGSGKSVALQMEAARAGHYILARSLLNGALDSQVFETPLYIDALDVVRAGDTRPADAVDRIVTKLRALGCPRFRLACRAAEWMGADEGELRAVSPDGQLVVLELQPLDDSDIDRLLRSLGVDDPQTLRHWAQTQRIDSFLQQPLLLELLVKAHQGGAATIRGRQDLFEHASIELLREHDPEIQQRRGPVMPTGQALHQAGLLCAVMLLSGTDHIHRIDPPAMGQDARETLALSRLLQPLNAGLIASLLRSRLFVGDAVQVEPLHRSVAGYLAARALHQHLTQQPHELGRMLSWLQGEDGVVVEPLRELAAWLCTLNPLVRAELIDTDPLGLLLYGDGSSLDRNDRRRLLTALQRQAQAFPHFRYAEHRDDWSWPRAEPFAALCKADVEPELRAALTDTRRDKAHHAYLDCVLDSLQHGDTLPALAPALLEVMRDESHDEGNRVAALKAWLRLVPPASPGITRLLDRLRTGAITDPHDRLLGTLLDAAFPHCVDPAELAQHFKVWPDNAGFGAYEWFWLDMAKRMSGEQFGALADGLVAIDLPKVGRDAGHSAFNRLQAIVLGALQGSNPANEPGRITGWLGLLLDDRGYSALAGDTKAGDIRIWLSEHPDTQAAVLAHRVAAREAKGPLTRYDMGLCHQSLHGSTLPDDWPLRLLRIAAGVQHAETAELLVAEAVQDLQRGHLWSHPGRAAARQWMHDHLHRWPQHATWWENALLHRQWYRHDALRASREHWLRQQRWQRSQRHHWRHDRRRLRLGLAPSVKFLVHARHAIRPPSPDDGSTAQERLQRELHLTPAEALAALEALHNTLKRADLPSADEVLRAALAGSWYWLRDPCLAAADMAHAEHPGCAHEHWPAATADMLLAFCISWMSGFDAGWISPWLQQHADRAEHVLQTYLVPAIQQRPDHASGVLRRLTRHGLWQPILARLLPQLIERYSPRLGGKRFFVLGPSLLSAATQCLSPDELQGLARAHLALPLRMLAPTQRMAWLLIAMGTAPRQRVRELASLVDGHARLRSHLLQMLDTTHADGIDMALSLPTAARLARLLLPDIDPRDEPRSGVVNHDPARNVSRRLLQVLETADHPSASDEWAALLADTGLEPWRENLHWHLHQRRRRQRNAHQSWPSAVQVMLALQGQARLHARDLQAVCQAAINQLERDLRDREGEALRVFWHDPPNRSKSRVAPTHPQDELTCRNRLLPYLRSQLAPQGVAVLPEVEHANQRRADLGLSFTDRQGSWRLPVEIKCESHRDVWTAWEHQLADYARHPETDGCGLYLVMWFGIAPRALGRGARRPSAALSMQQALHERIPDELRPRLQVRVLDLSWPQQAGSARADQRPA